MPSDTLNKAKELLHRYQQYSNLSNLQDIVNLLDSVYQIDATTVSQGSLSLIITTGSFVDFTWYYVVNGLNFANGLALHLGGGSFGIVDQTQFVNVGNATLGVTQEQAVEIGLNVAKNVLAPVKQSDGSHAQVPIALKSQPLSIFLLISTVMA